LPVPFGRFDAICIASGVLSLVAWSLAPLNWLTGLLASFAAVLHFVRLVRWRGLRTWRSMLLLMLHIAYAMIPIGFFAIALTSFGLGTSAAPAHVFGIGAIGGMTVAVMMRATLGHTGRPLAAGRALGLAFSMLIMALGARVVGQSFGLGHLDGIDLAAALWMIAFLILALRLGPWVARPKLSAKRPTSVPHG
jgi:uncharacterized protein involved in response to NO